MNRPDIRTPHRRSSRREEALIGLAASISWPVVKLDEVCVGSTGTRDPGAEPDKIIRYVDISSVDNRAKRITEAKTLLGKVAPSRARQIILANDVLVATTRPNLNAVALVPPDLDGEMCSTGFCVLRPTPEVDPEYLFLFVQSDAFAHGLADLVKGALYPAVSDKQVRARPIPLPPLAEQRRIAGRLREQMAEVARARAAVQAQLAAAQA
ncbi:MAG: restriction endonuclease subunit S, partial [Proteobacteria bacterium]|nr:restriction endonuclease subunit S [Pseudomonadota bacterium]